MFFDEIEWKRHLGSTDVAGRVLHWSPTRGAASEFFFFFRFVLTQLRFEQIWLQFLPNRANSARIRLYWPNHIVLAGGRYRP